MRILFLSWLCVLLSVCWSQTSVFAQNKNENEIRTLLINKLNNVYINLASEDPAKQSLSLRIADLLSERARAESRMELGQGCTICRAGSEDRAKALLLYKEVLPKLSAEHAGRVLTQIGHLYELTGNEAEAVKTYKKSISDNKDLNAVAEAELSLAEIFFKKNNFTEARRYYEKVFQSEARISKGLAAYRIAWCDFRFGKGEEAAAMLQKILSSPELLSRSSQIDVTSVDQQFQEEVARDFVIFLAQNKANASAAQLVYDLSPSNSRLNHVLSLAVELERLGLKLNSIAVLRFLQEKETRPLQRLEGYVRLAQLEMEQKNLTVAAEDYNRALLIWPDVCASNVLLEGNCKELATRIKNFAIDWYKLEQKNPEEQLYAVYVSYLKVFPDEANIQLQAASIAKHLKNWIASAQHFNNAAEIYIVQKTHEKLEDVLLNQIEVAELSKDNFLLNKALSHYLQASLSRASEIKVRYQQAKLQYDKNAYDLSADMFREVAVVPGETFLDLKEKAADLALDSLVLLQDEKRLEIWARDFAKIFIAKNKSFLAIANRSILNKAVAVSKASPAQALEALLSIDKGSLNLEEQVTVSKNIIILAEQTERFDIARREADVLLAIQGGKPEDRVFALEHKIYLAELTLDFLTAYQAASEISLPKGDMHWLKMALLAELAHKPSKPYYIKFINETKNQNKAEAIAAKLIKDSDHPRTDVSLYKNIFKDNPEYLGALYLDIFAKTKDQKIISDIAKERSLKSTFAYKTLLRQNLISDFSKLKLSLANHKIDYSNQKKMSQTIKERGKYLTQFEALAKRAIDLEDFTSQLLSLDILGKENKRFYEEVLSLPLPEGLSPEEQGQYLQLLSQQVGANQIRAQDLEVKVNEFWQNKTAMDALFSIYPQQEHPVRELLKAEVVFLTEIAPPQYQAQFANFWTSAKSAPEFKKIDFKIIEQARSDLRQDPLNKDKVVKLLDLEKGFGESAMVSYLESRLANLQAKDTK